MGGRETIINTNQTNKLELIEHMPLIQACAVVLIGVSDIGVAMMGNQKALFVTLVDLIPRFEAYIYLKPVFCQVRLIRCVYESLRCLDVEIWGFCADDRRQTNQLLYPLLCMRARGVMSDSLLQ